MEMVFLEESKKLRPVAPLTTKQGGRSLLSSDGSIMYYNAEQIDLSVS